MKANMYTCKINIWYLLPPHKAAAHQGFLWVIFSKLSERDFILVLF